MKLIIKNLILLTLFLNSAIYAGTNTLTDRETGQTILKEFFNDIHDALNDDLVGRNSLGAATSGQNLGNATYRWVIYGTTGNFSSDLTVSGALNLTGAFTPSGQIRLSDGSLTEPSWVWTSDDDGTGTGAYRSAANTISLVSNGAEVLSIASTGVSNTGTISSSGQMLGAASQASSAPSYSFTGDGDLGWYRAGIDDMRAAAAGADVLTITTSGISITGTISATGAISGASVSATGNISSGGVFLAAAGSAASPSISFTGDPDSGFYSYGVNQIGISTNATVRSVVHTDGIAVVNGDSSNPAIGWLSDHDGSGTGFFRHAANQIGIAINGSDIGYLGSGLFLLDLPNTANTSTLAVDNNDNTSTASHAVLRAAVGGAAGGDPFLRLTVYGGATYSFGIDNTDSDILKLTNNSSGPSFGTTFFSTTTAGLFTFGVDGTGPNVINDKLSIVKTGAGASQELLVSHTDNTNASSHSFVHIRNGGESGGDSYIQFENNGVTSWSAGMDNSDSDTYKVSQTAGLGTNDYFQITTAGKLKLGGGGGGQQHELNGRIYIAQGAASTNAIEAASTTTTGAVKNVAFNSDGTRFFRQNNDFAAGAELFSMDSDSTTGIFSMSRAGLVTIGTGTSVVHRVNGPTVAPDLSTATFLTAPATAAGEPDVWARINWNGTEYIFPLWTN